MKYPLSTLTGALAMLLWLGTPCGAPEPVLLKVPPVQQWPMAVPSPPVAIVPKVDPLADVVEFVREGEGELRLRVYKDTWNHSIGWGCSLDSDRNIKHLKDMGIKASSLLAGKLLTRRQAEELFRCAVQDAMDACDRVVPHFKGLPMPVRRVLVDMAYVLGPSGLSDFTTMLGAIAHKDWRTMAKRIRRSEWHKQVGWRAERDAKIIDLLIDEDR